jgi:CDP-paratose 2-epimerase
VLDYAHSYGLPTCVLRMSCIYGPHQHGTEDQGWVAHFLRQALAGEPITVYGDGHQVRDLLFVEDLVDALLAVSSHPRALEGRVFNIGGGARNARTVQAVAEMIGELLGARPRLAAGEWRTADQRYYVSDTSALNSLIGWSPRTSVQSGLAQLYAWLRGEERPSTRAVAAAGASA